MTSLVFSQKADDLIGDLNTELLDSLVFEEVNKVRLENEQPKLYWNESLASKAQLHSAEMVKQKKAFYDESTEAGQCIVDMLLIQYDVTYGEAAKWVVERWMNSPGHKDLMINSFFTSGGIGSAFTFSEEIGIQLKVAMFLKYE